MLVNGNIGLEDIGLKSLTVVSVILSPLLFRFAAFTFCLLSVTLTSNWGSAKKFKIFSRFRLVLHMAIKSLFIF